MTSTQLKAALLKRSKIENSEAVKMAAELTLASLEEKAVEANKAASNLRKAVDLKIGVEAVLRLMAKMAEEKVA